MSSLPGRNAGGPRPVTVEVRLQLTTDGSALSVASHICVKPPLSEKSRLCRDDLHRYIVLVIRTGEIQVATEFRSFTQGFKRPHGVAGKDQMSVVGCRHILEVFLTRSVVIKNEVRDASAVEELSSDLADNCAVLANTMETNQEGIGLWYRTVEFVFHNERTIAFEKGHGGEQGRRSCHLHSLSSAGMPTASVQRPRRTSYISESGRMVTAQIHARTVPKVISVTVDYCACFGITNGTSKLRGFSRVLN